MIVNDFVAVLTRVPVTAILVLVGVSAWFLLAGCQTLALRLETRPRAYNEVIARTSSEQTLGLIVRLRY
jgi:hypothetical protein